MLFCYTKQTIIKVIKMIVVNSKMKRKKKRKEKQLSIKQVKRGYVY